MLQQVLAAQAQQTQQLAQVMALVQNQPVASLSIVPCQFHYAKQQVVQHNTGRALHSSPNAVTAEAAQQELVLGSWGAASISYGAVSYTHQRNRAAAFEEYAEWHNSRMPALGVARPATCALPEELVLYHQTHWIKQHGETVLQGQVYPAPSSLANNFSLLASMFDMLGRTGAYSAESQVSACTQWRDQQMILLC